MKISTKLATTLLALTLSSTLHHRVQAQDEYDSTCIALEGDVTCDTIAALQVVAALLSMVPALVAAIMLRTRAATAISFSKIETKPTYVLILKWIPRTKKSAEKKRTALLALMLKGPTEIVFATGTLTRLLANESPAI